MWPSEICGVSRSVMPTSSRSIVAKVFARFVSLVERLATNGTFWPTTISASSGIGYMTMNAREFLQTDVVLLGVVLYALLGKLADAAARALERWCLAWYPNFQSKLER